MYDVIYGVTGRDNSNSLGAGILGWTNYIVNYIRNVLDRMRRRSGFGRKDVYSLWCDDFG